MSGEEKRLGERFCQRKNDRGKLLEAKESIAGQTYLQARPRWMSIYDSYEPIH